MVYFLKKTKKDRVTPCSSMRDFSRKNREILLLKIRGHSPSNRSLIKRGSHIPKLFFTRKPVMKRDEEYESKSG
jgi:hypothetical protein